MAILVMKLIFALLAGTALSAQAAADGPVDKVVTLLTTLKTDLDNDEKSEQAVYDKYACWCEKTTQRKAQSIEDAKTMLKSTGQDILKLKGRVSVRADEIDEKNQQIKDNEEAQEMATTARSKENGKWQEDSATTNQAMTAINMAIDTLKKATSPALLQQDATALLQKTMTSVLDAAPAHALAALTTQKLAVLRNFAKVSGKAGYAPQSVTIQGILGDMYTTMGTDLQDSTSLEAKRNRIFEGYMAEKSKELSKLKEMLTKKSREKAEAQAMLAESTEAFDDVSNQLKADVEFFDNTKDACQKTTDSWGVRHKLREDEIDGIAEALKILTGPEAKKLFAKAIKPGMEKTMLLQTGHRAAPKQMNQLDLDKIYGKLKEKATKSHSLRLAALAAQVKSAKAGHFDKVIKSIDSLIGVLGREQDSDTTKRNDCEEQYQDISQESNNLDWKITNNEAKIQKFENLIEKLQGEKDQAIKEIDETNQNIKDITAERKTDNAAFIQAKKDDLASIQLLEKAKEVMLDFYTKNAVKMDLVQTDASPLEDADKAPDATFSGKGQRKNQSKGIVSLLSMIIEDLNAEVENEVKNEEQSQVSYEQLLATANKLLEDLKAKKASLEGAIANRKGDKTDESKDKKANDADLDAQKKTKASIKTDCDYMLAKYTERRKYRASEMEALRDAKEFLVSYADPAEALVQSAPSKASLSHISFSHIASPHVQQ